MCAPLRDAEPRSYSPPNLPLHERHLMLQCRAIAPHITVTSVHPGMIITEIAGKNLAMDNADARFLDVMPPWERRKLEGMNDADRVVAVKSKVAESFNRFGTTAAKAASIIVSGVVAKKTRVLVGWDAHIMDWWIRLFPRIFMSFWGRAVVMGSSIIGQHLVVPFIVVVAAVCFGVSLTSNNSDGHS